MFSMLDKAIRLDSVFEQGVPLKHVPRVLFLFMLAIVYIANSHFSNKLTRRLNKTQAEVEELRVDYTTTKAAYMEAGKQSKVAANVADMGLEESSVPPRKIKLNDEE